jgi:pimeloyl-ACP methyl ester carboxylesterase
MDNFEQFNDAGSPFKMRPGLADWGRTITLPGASLFYYDVAPGAAAAPSMAAPTMTAPKERPALVLVHGLGDEADTWRRLIPILSRAGLRIIAPDLAGFGRSSVRRKISLDMHADLLIRLMKESGAADSEHPALLAGNSLGAVIAEIAAAKRPDLVKALALIDGCFPLSGGLDRNLLLMALPFIGRRWYRSFRDNPEAAWKSLYPYYRDLEGMDGDEKEFLRERVMARVRSAAQERAYFASLRSMNRLSLFGRPALSFAMRIYTGKILLLWGAEDKVLPPERCADFTRIRPDAKPRLIAGAGHLPHQEKPDETAAELLRFIDSL